jgi:hypothetical protein
MLLVSTYYGDRSLLVLSIQGEDVFAKVNVTLRKFAVIVNNFKSEILISTQVR